MKNIATQKKSSPKNSKKHKFYEAKFATKDRMKYTCILRKQKKQSKIQK